MPRSGPTLQAAYEAESRALCCQAVQITCWLALPLIVLFGVLESSGLLAAPDFFPALRIGCSTSLAGVLYLLRRPVGQRHPKGLFGVVITAVGLMLLVMTVPTGREQSPYFVGLPLGLLATAVFMPWPVGCSAAVSVGVVAGYLVAMLATGPIGNSRMFYSNVSEVLATGLLATASTWFRERLRWREFANRAALADALTQRREFMAKMSHELRTPLHVIIGYADILLEEFVAADQADARVLIDRSRASAVTLNRMISDLLDYAKVEGGKMEVRQEPVCVPDVLASLVDGFRPIIERKGLTLEAACEAALPELVSDRQRVEQILVNLVGNAIKFTQKGGIAVEARLVSGPLDGFRVLGGGAATSDGATAGAPQLAILVRDTGVGIAEGDLTRLAQDFSQVADAAAGHYGGTGLGLSISKKLAQLLGGRLAVRSRRGEGSTVALILPAPAPRHRAAA